MGRVYSPEMIQWLRDRVDGKTRRCQIAEEFNRHFDTDFTVNQIICCMKNHKIRCGCKGGGKKILWSDEMIQWLRDRVDGKTDRPTLAKELNGRFGADFTVEQVATCMKNHKICCGVDTKFQKGVSKRKGAKLPEHIKIKSASGWFRKGDSPYNTDNVGTEKSVGGYIWVKVNDVTKPDNKRVNWIQKHRLIWEEAYGPIPDGGLIIFKNGDLRDFRLDNLALVSKSESRYYSSFAGARENRARNDEINECIVSMARLQSAIKRRKDGG